MSGPLQHYLDPRSIIVRRETRQRQQNISDIADLTASIRATGLINPLVVRTIEGQPVLVAGERRLLACLANDMPLVPVRFFENSKRTSSAKTSTGEIRSGASGSSTTSTRPKIRFG